MPRPQKKRQVCCEPQNRAFFPQTPLDRETAVLKMDEYETVRLIDLEGLTQEECAGRLGVSRTTVQGVYDAARHTLADALVHGKRLVISGGDYVLCRHGHGPCGKGCQKQRQHACHYTIEGGTPMKLAVPYDNGMVFGHFGHTEQFKLYETDGETITASEVVPTQGAGHGALAGFLAQRGVQALICGGIGGGARAALAEANIQVYPGVSGSADDNVRAFLSGTLEYQPDAQCNHHHEGEHHCSGHGEDGHHCGGHSCGGHGQA